MGRMDQRLASLVGRQAPGILGNDSVRHHAGQPIGAQDHHIVGRELQRFGPDNGHDLRIRTERLENDIADRAVAGLFRAELPVAHHLRDQRLVLAELRHGAIPQEISAAVAHMGEPCIAVAYGNSRACRPHALAFGIVLGPVRDGAMGGQERRAEHVRHRTGQLVIDAAHGLDGDFAGDFAGGVTAHSVRHQHETAAGFHRVAGLRCNKRHAVLVVRAHSAVVGPHGSLRMQPARRSFAS